MMTRSSFALSVQLFAALLFCVLALAAAVPAAAQHEGGVSGVNLRQAAGEVQKSDARISQAEALDIFLEGRLSPDEALFLSSLEEQVYGNVALVRQGAGTTGNEANLTQQGSGNQAILFQLGSNNLVDLLQSGRNNVFGARLGGNANTLSVMQIGIGHEYILDNDFSNVDYGTVRQFGLGNRIVQTGNTRTPFGVEQYGNGMQLTIQHNQ